MLSSHAFLKSKMADSRELQTNLTEYRAQLQQVSFFRSELREFVRFPCKLIFVQSFLKEIKAIFYFIVG